MVGNESNSGTSGSGGNTNTSSINQKPKPSKPPKIPLKDNSFETWFLPNKKPIREDDTWGTKSDFYTWKKS